MQAKLEMAAQPAVAADRFAPEIVRFLTVSAVRLRRLNGRAFGTRGNAFVIPFRFGCGVSGVLKARCAVSVVQKPVVQGVVRRLVVLKARCAGCGTNARYAAGSLLLR